MATSNQVLRSGVFAIVLAAAASMAVAQQVAKPPVDDPASNDLRKAPKSEVPPSGVVHPPDVDPEIAKVVPQVDPKMAKRVAPVDPSITVPPAQRGTGTGSSQQGASPAAPDKNSGGAHPENR